VSERGINGISRWMVHDILGSTPETKKVSLNGRENQLAQTKERERERDIEISGIE